MDRIDRLGASRHLDFQSLRLTLSPVIVCSLVKVPEIPHFGSWPSTVGARPDVPDPVKGTWLVYIDDSGDGSSGSEHDILTALCIPSARWTFYLKHWKNYRRRLQKTLGFPSGAEFHSSPFCAKGNLRGTLPSSYDVPYVVHRGSNSVSTRPKEFENALKLIGSFSDARILTCYRQARQGSGELYEPLMEWLEEFLQWNDSYAIVWYDGTGQNLHRHRRSFHRTMPFTRRVLEDAIATSSADSQLIQMSDAVAFSALQAIRFRQGLKSHPDTIAASYRYVQSLAWPDGMDSDEFPTQTGEFGFRIVP